MFSRPLNKYRVALGVLSLLALSALAGCASVPSAPGETTAASAPAQTPSATAESPSPTPSATPLPEIAGNYELCRSFVPDATQAKLADLDAPFMDDVLEKKILEDESAYEEEEGFSDARFVHLGGVICGWGVLEEGGMALELAYGPLPADQVEQQQEALLGSGAKRLSENRFSQQDGYPGEYVFGDGYWVFMILTGEFQAKALLGKDLDPTELMDQIIQRLPAF